jgi:hypothetical protein
VEIEQFTPIARQLRKGVSLSCFGYGMGFNEALLSSLAKTGNGNDYFIESPDNVAKVFAVELGGLLTCYAQDILMAVKAHKGTTVLDVLNDLDVETTQDSDGELVTKIKVGDIYAGEKRDIIVKLAVEKRGQALPRPVTLADVTLSYRAMSDALTKTETAKTKIELVKTAAEATKDRDAKITEQVAILEAAVVMAKAKQMADAGNWLGARGIITASSVRLQGIGTDDAVKYACVMDGFASSLGASYCAGDSLSKSMGNVAYATRSRLCRAAGTSSQVADMGTHNSVTVDLMRDFSQDSTPVPTSVPVPASVPGGDEDDGEGKPDGTTTASTSYFGKTRRSG